MRLGLVLFVLLAAVLGACGGGKASAPPDAEAGLRAQLERSRHGSSHVIYQLHDEGFDNPNLDWKIEWRNQGVTSKRVRVTPTSDQADQPRDFDLIMTTKDWIAACAENARITLGNSTQLPNGPACVRGSFAENAADVLFLVSGLTPPAKSEAEATQPIDLSDVKIQGVSQRRYASKRATCYQVLSTGKNGPNEQVETCWADDGTVLFRASKSSLGTRQLEAVEVIGTPAKDADFQLPYPLVKVGD